MNTYEIRIVANTGTSAIYSSSHISDHAAFRRALVLAKPGDVIEVWRGAICVYCGMPDDDARWDMDKFQRYNS